jgi:hypothetical protein
MSAIPPKADIDGRCLDVRFVPIGDIEERVSSGAKRHDLPELYTFVCRPCGVSHIEAAFRGFSPREHSCPAIGNK